MNFSSNRPDYITHSFLVRIHLDTGPHKTVFCPETERRIASTVSTPPPSESSLHTSLMTRAPHPSLFVLVPPMVA